MSTTKGMIWDLSFSFTQRLDAKVLFQIICCSVRAPIVTSVHHACTLVFSPRKLGYNACPFLPNQNTSGVTRWTVKSSPITLRPNSIFTSPSFSNRMLCSGQINTKHRHKSVEDTMMKPISDSWTWHYPLCFQTKWYLRLSCTVCSVRRALKIRYISSISVVERRRPFPDQFLTFAVSSNRFYLFEVALLTIP